MADGDEKVFGEARGALRDVEVADGGGIK